MAYTVKLGIGLNPTTSGTFVDFSSNSADGVSLLGEPPFKWDAKEDDVTQVRRGTVPGKRNTAVINNNATFTLFVDFYAANQTALVSKILQVNQYMEQARLYDEYNGAIGAPIFITIQMHGTSQLFYLQVIGGQRIGVDSGKLSDATWLSSVGEGLKLVFHCLPEIKGEKVTLYNTLPNGDFQNDNAIQGNTGGIDYWSLAVGLGWSIDSTNGYFGSNCAKFTGSAASNVYQNINSNFIPISALGLTAGTNVCMSFWLKRDSSCTLAMDARISYYNGGTNVSHTTQAFVAVVANMTGASGWTQYYMTDVIPSSAATQFRLEFYLSQAEATSFHMYLDGVALWVNQTVPPVGGEYMTISGNNICPSRIYNVQGNVPSLMRLYTSPRNAAWTTNAHSNDTFDIGVNPHEAGGYLGTTSGNTGFDKPIPFCRPTSVTTSGSNHYYNINCTVDLTQRVYILKGRATGSAYTGLFYLKDATSTRVIDDSGSIGVTVGNFSLYTLYEFNAFYSPDTMTSVAGGIEAMDYGTSLTNVINVNCPNGANTVNISHLYFIRTDWGYGYMAILTSLSLSTNWTVYDSTSGYVQIKSVTAPWTTSQVTQDVTPDVRGSTLRLMPGPGIVNDLQIISNFLATNQNDYLDDFVVAAVEYYPKYKGLAR